jgi:hypothetical protein
MAMLRRMMQLTRDVKNPRPVKGGRQELAQEKVIEKGSLFVNEIITECDSDIVVSDTLVYLDADFLEPLESYEKGSPLYEALAPALKRVPRSAARILVELNMTDPESLWGFLDHLVKGGACNLEDVKKAAFAYRRSVDYDMQDEDDTVDLATFE